MSSAPARDRRGVLAAALALLLAAQESRAQLEGTALAPDDLSSIAQFGASVAVHGDVLAVGAPYHDVAGPAAGAIFVHRQVDGAWQPEGVLTLDAPEPAAFLGRTLAFDGKTLATGATGPGDGGVYLFERELVDDQASWTAEARLVPGTPTADFGYSLDVDGDTVVVGTLEVLGRVFVFERSAQGWTLADVLQPDDLSAGDAFGSALALSGDRLVVGAPRSHVDAEPGRVFAYRRIDGTWTEDGCLVPDVEPLHGGFGYALDLDGAACVVGAYEAEDSGKQPGQAYLFRRGDEGWVQESELVADLGHVPASFGQSVALSGGLALVGAFNEEPPADAHDDEDAGAYQDDGHETSGAAYAFRRLGPLWIPTEVLVPHHPEEHDQFARAVSLAGDVALVGAPRAEGHGQAYVFDLPTLLGHSIDVGGALAAPGTQAPQLVGQGALQAGTAFVLSVVGGSPGATAVLVAGTSVAWTPFHGGTLVPSPDALVPTPVLDEHGALTLIRRWPPGLPPGFLLVFQVWIADRSAPLALTASNGVVAVAP